MEKKYFGSPALQNTIRSVKSKFPECKILFKEDDNQKMVSFKFDSVSRKKYKLSEGYRTYLFLNNHLILSNGATDPFKYDDLDALIESCELQYDVTKQKDSITKTRAAIDNCIYFLNTAVITFGNKREQTYDIKFVLNEIERAYLLDLNSDTVHMEKIEAETKLERAEERKLKDLNPNIIYKILKTTHPGLKTSATEYISGLKADKVSWKSVEDAYVKPWKKEIYESFGLNPLDVLTDTTESRQVGEYAESPMRRLVLIDGSQYAYREDTKEVIPYEDYQKKRSNILKQYKIWIMEVCKKTGIIAPKAIEALNVYKGKINGPVVFRNPNEAIREIRMKRLGDPIDGVISKINRSIKLYNHEIGFTAFLRKSVPTDALRRLDINENGNVIKIDIDMVRLDISIPYIITPGRNRLEVDNLEKFKLTELYINSLKEEIQKMKTTPEYKLFLFVYEMNKIGITGNKVIYDEDNSIFRVFFIGELIIYVNPYKSEISINDRKYIEESKEIYEKYNRMMSIYGQIFTE